MSIMIPTPDRLEALLLDCEALKFYPEVKRVRDSLVKELKALKIQLRRMATEAAGLSQILGRERESKAGVVRELDAERTRGKELLAKFDTLQAEVAALEAFKVPLEGAAHLSLEEAVSRMLEAEEAEVSRRVSEREEEISAALEAVLPKKIEDRLREILSAGEWPPEVARAVEGTAWTGLRDKSSWPAWFKASVEEEVSRRVKAGLDQEFQDRVEAAVGGRFKALKAGEWGRFVEERTGAILEEGLPWLLRTLMGDHDARCDRCGGVFRVHVGLAEISVLLSAERSISLKCPHGCTDPPGFFKPPQPHTFLLQLAPLLARVILKDRGKPPASFREGGR